MKKILTSIFSVTLALTFFGGAINASADEIISEEITPAQLVEIFISLDIISPDQAQIALDALSNWVPAEELVSVQN